MKRVLAFITMLFILLSVCALAEPVKTEMDPYSPYEETLVLTTGKSSVASPNFANPNDNQGDNELTRYILEKLNVKIELLWESDDYTNKLALQMASNDLPDMFTLDSSGSGYLMYRQLQENGMLADLTDGIHYCLSDRIKKDLEGYGGRQFEAFTEDGRIYAYASPLYAYDNHQLLWLRQDWMDALGLKAPKTLEELEEVLVAFRDHYESVGLPLDAKNPMIRSAIAAAYNAYPGAWIAGENGETEYGSLSQGTRDALELLARWYQEGLVDKEFVARTDSMSLFTAGKTGTLLAPWWAPYSLGQIAADIPEAKLSVANAPLSAEGKFNVLGPNQSGNLLLVNAKCQNPEAAMKVFSVTLDSYAGFDQEGFARIKADIDNNCSWPAIYPVGGVSATPYDFVPQNGRFIADYVKTGALEGNASELQVNRAKTAKQFYDGEAGDGEAFVNYYAWYLAATLSDEACVTDVFPVFSYTTESMGDLKANLDAMEEAAFLKIIIGEKPIEYFDEFCAQWKAEGGDIVTQEVRELVGQ